MLCTDNTIQRCLSLNKIRDVYNADAPGTRSSPGRPSAAGVGARTNLGRESVATGPRRGVQEQSSARTDEEAQESSFPTGQTTGSSEKDIQMGPNVLPCSCDFYTPHSRFWSGFGICG